MNKKQKIEIRRTDLKGKEQKEQKDQRLKNLEVQVGNKRKKLETIQREFNFKYLLIYCYPLPVEVDLIIYQVDID